MTQWEADYIRRAKRLLSAAGVMSMAELDANTIKWCRLRKGSGMAPQPGQILLDKSLQGDDFNTALTLAHETYHQHQYQKLGPARFKCEYHAQYVQCDQCQDREHPIEREAYQFEDRAFKRLDRYLRDGVQPLARELSLRVWNTDDRVDLYINGRYRASCGFDEDCNWELIRWLESGENYLELQLFNLGGPYRYSYRLHSDIEAIVEESCGDHSRSCSELGGPYAVGTGSFTKSIFSHVIELNASGQ
jgi:hypothetical protein